MNRQHVRLVEDTDVDWHRESPFKNDAVARYGVWMQVCQIGALCSKEWSRRPDPESRARHVVATPLSRPSVAGRADSVTKLFVLLIESSPSKLRPSRNTHDTRAMHSGNLRHNAETFRTRRSQALHEFRDFRRFVVISY
jgi:hypothetical protein